MTQNAPVVAQKQEKILETHYKSPKHTNKNMERHSGNKLKGILESPMCVDNMNHIIQHVMLSASKKSRSPLKHDPSFKGFISAPKVVHSKNHFCSPNHNSKHDPEVSENDGRFSSNTTERYRTQCSKGSVIHSNFKINQNSLQKPPKPSKSHLFKPSKN